MSRDKLSANRIRGREINGSLSSEIKKLAIRKQLLEWPSVKNTRGSDFVIHIQNTLSIPFNFILTYVVTLSGKYPPCQVLVSRCNYHAINKGGPLTSCGINQT